MLSVARRRFRARRRSSHPPAERPHCGRKEASDDKSRFDGVVPLSVERVAGQVDRRPVRRLRPRRHAGRRPRRGGRRPSGRRSWWSLRSGSMTVWRAEERLAAPVARDEAEQAVLDLVPLARAGREVADLDLKAGLVGQALQLGLPQPGAVAVGAAAVGGDRQRRGLRVARRAELLPPALDRGDRELGGVVVDPDADPALVVGEVVDAVGDRLAQFLVFEVVGADLDRVALGAPLAPAVLEVADQLLLLGVDARSPAHRPRAAP